MCAVAASHSQVSSRKHGLSHLSPFVSCSKLGCGGGEKLDLVGLQNYRCEIQGVGVSETDGFVK